MRLDIKINDEEATPLACIVHRDKSYQMGKALTEKLKELIPRQLFKVRLTLLYMYRSTPRLRPDP